MSAMGRKRTLARARLRLPERPQRRAARLPLNPPQHRNDGSHGAQQKRGYNNYRR